MARPQKSGLDYFSLDVVMSDEVEIIEAEYGLEGFAILIKLYQKIYSEGYYYQWGDKEQILFSNRVSVDRNKLTTIVNDCVKWGLFDENLYKKYKILTSRRIQSQYFTATYKRTGVESIKEYLLIDISDRDNVLTTRVSDDRNTPTTDDSDDKSTQSKEEKSKEEKSKKDTHVKVLDMYHEKLDELPKVLKLNDSRKKAINARLEEYSLEDIKTVFEKASESDFLTGRSKDWSANFDWIMKPTNFIKILEGNYDNRKGGQNGNSSGDNREGANETSKWGIDHLIQRAEN